MDDPEKLIRNIYAELSAHEFLLSGVLALQFASAKKQTAEDHVQWIKKNIRFAEFPESFDQEVAAEMGPAILETRNKAIHRILDALERAGVLRAGVAAGKAE